ncbi:MAG: hypothetical protein ACRD34_07335 [Bryobacteraceae bacterium]
MRSRWIALVLGLAFAQLLLAKHKREQPPKPLPLPPQLPMALAAQTRSLEFRISPLLAKGGLDAQIGKSLNDLIHQTRGERIIKLRAFVSGAGDARMVSQKASRIFTQHKLPLPVVSIVQVGALGGGAAEVVIEAVVESRQVFNPNGLAFFSGQRAPSFQQSVERLSRSVRAVSVPAGNVLTCTCFVPSLANAASLRATLGQAFPASLIALVQPLRQPDNNETMCEAAARLSAPPRNGPVEVLKHPRVSLVNSPQLIFTGLQLSFGAYLEDAHEAFARLRRDASAVQPVQGPVSMNIFALDPYAASALLREATAPRAIFTVRTVEGLPAIDASAGIEAVFAAKPAAPASVGR